MDNEQDFGGNAPAVFQYMPPGRSVICASVNGKPGRREVVVDAATAERLQADLEEKLAAFAAHAKPRPCGLFDHKSGAASLIPQRFSWDEERGVLLEAVWTNAGRAAVEGRDYSYWSPSFRLNADGSVVGLQAGVEVGSLVNDPAFERIELVAAGRQEVDEPEEGVVEVNGGSARETHAEENEDGEVDDAPVWREDPPRSDAEIAQVDIEEIDAELDTPGCTAERRKELRARRAAALKRLAELDPKKAEKYKPACAKCSKVDFGSAIGVLAGRVAAVAESDADARGAVADLAVSVRAAFEAVDAANPYGCNQHGHGFKREHEGYGAGGQKTLDLGDTVDKQRAKEVKELERLKKDAVDKARKAREASKKWDSIDWRDDEGNKKAREAADKAWDEADKAKEDLLNKRGERQRKEYEAAPKRGGSGSGGGGGEAPKAKEPGGSSAPADKYAEIEKRHRDLFYEGETKGWTPERRRMFAVLDAYMKEFKGKRGAS